MRNRSRSYHYLSALTVLLVLPCGAAASAAEDAAREAGASTERRANGLINETSPYLLQHAYNPVDWLPWGDEAIERARREQKPILLSVGYSTCYWCHVMEREVFENEEIAQQLNQQFVCVKVDREERPDIDGVYMTATQILIRRGGWPMNVFLTPPAKDATGADAVGYGLKPFFCTTYLPAEPKDGLPSFPQVSGRMHALWTDRRDQVLDQAERLASAVQRVMADSADGGPVTAASVRSAGDAVLDEYDPQHGGFGNATRGQKFPQPSKLAMLLTVSHLDSDAPKNARQAVLHTLDQMARGGIFDQVGGGFHRYSTDPQWLIPHFEKMLYDNAQLLSVYAQALRLERQSGEGDASRAQRYERVLRETADYLLEEMADESGAFWSAQDAEVDGREGLSYLWTPQEVRQAIGDASLADLAAPMYGLDRDPNFKDPHAPDAPPAYVLHLPTPLEELARRRGLTLAELLEKRRQINQQLKAARDERDLPATDDKVIVSWNGLAIRGLAHAGEVLNEPRYVAAAEKAADAILTHMAAGGDALYRTMRAEQPQGAALLEDYTHLAAGLLALAQVSQDDRYRREAERLTLHARDQFGAETGGYYDTRSGQDDLFVRVRLIYDDATPSGNSVMVQNLLTLHEQTGEPLWLSRAVQDLRSFAAEIDQQGASMPGMVQAWWRAAQSQDAKAGLTAP